MDFPRYMDKLGTILVISVSHALSLKINDELRCSDQQSIALFSKSSCDQNACHQSHIRHQFGIKKLNKTEETLLTR